MEYYGFILNNISKKQENKFHKSIFKEIYNNLNPNNYTKITSSNYISTYMYIKTTYYFYNLNNYLIFKLYITSLYDCDDIILIDIEFTYSYNTLYYWTQFNNSILKLNMKKINHNQIKSHIILINEFIQINLLKNNLK